MIDLTDINYWDNKFEEKKEHKLNFGNKIIIVGVIVLGICTLINSILIYNFINLLNKL